MNEQYWKNYYKGKEQNYPSDFALFCLSRIPNGSLIVDLGAGDTRDTHILSTKVDCIAVEPNNDEVAYNNLHEVEARRVDIVYARWFFHAIEEEVEDDILDWCAKNGVTLMAEFRVVGGEAPDNSHERRLIDGAVFLRKLLDRGFKIEYYEESYGFSKVGNNDPYLGRVIAKR